MSKNTVERKKNKTPAQNKDKHFLGGPGRPNNADSQKFGRKKDRKKPDNLPPKKKFGRERDNKKLDNLPLKYCVNYELSKTEDKREEYRSTHKSYQFFYILYQLGILNLIGKENAMTLLNAYSNNTPYQVHHIFPLGLGGTNDFDNLCLIDKDLHAFVHHYCLSQRTVNLIKKQPIEKRSGYMKRFVPSFTPIVRVEDFFHETIICAAKSCIDSAAIDTLKQRRKPISSNDVKSFFPPDVIKKCEFDPEAFNYLVNLYILHRLSQNENTRRELQTKISQVERKLLEPSGKYRAGVEDIRQKYNNPQVWKKEIARHRHACRLINEHGVPPVFVLTAKDLSSTASSIKSQRCMTYH